MTLKEYYIASQNTLTKGKKEMDTSFKIMVSYSLIIVVCAAIIAFTVSYVLYEGSRDKWSPRKLILSLLVASILSLGFGKAILEDAHATMYPPKGALIELKHVRGGTVYLKKDENITVKPGSRLYGGPRIKLTYPVCHEFELDISEHDTDLKTLKNGDEFNLVGGEYLVQVIEPQTGNAISGHRIVVNSTSSN